MLVSNTVQKWLSAAFEGVKQDGDWYAFEWLDLYMGASGILKRHFQ